MAVKVTGVSLRVDFVVGVMLIPVSTAGLTVRLAPGDVMPLADALIVAIPTATPVTVPVLLLIVATPVSVDVHVTWLLISAVVPL